MAVVDLPDWPGPREVVPVLIDFGGAQDGATGGASQSIDRMGNRWRFEFVLPPLDHDDDGRTWAARLVRAQTSGARIDVPLAAGNQGAPGTAVEVNGANPTGRVLPVRGVAPGWVGKEGYWLSIEDADGNHYLHQLAGTVVIDSSGEADLPIEPMLRVPFADGATVHLATPKIQGLLTGNERSWSLNVMRHVGVSFTIQERK